MKKLLFIIPIAIVAASALYVFGTQGNKPEPDPVQTDEQASEKPKLEDSVSKFSDPIKSAHYVSNVPEHGSTLAEKPGSVAITFNFDLAAPSSISIKHDGREYGSGETLISSNKLTLSRQLSADLPNGLYDVRYRACWPDKSCHDGFFQFAIKR
jgi:methionine-rich copper-binding protein CopC